MTQFMKNRVDIISTKDLEEAVRFAQPFDELGVDVHIEYAESRYSVALYLHADMPLATVRGGILQDVSNMPPGFRLLIADYDHESTEPVLVKIERGFDYVEDVLKSGDVQINDGMSTDAKREVLTMAQDVNPEELVGHDLISQYGVRWLLQTRVEGSPHMFHLVNMDTPHTISVPSEEIAANCSHPVDCHRCSVGVE